MKAYEHFYRQNRIRLFAYLLRFTGDYQLASDLTQESFTRYLDRYSRNGGNCALLFTIARNAALDATRKRRENRIKGDDAVSATGDPEQQLIEKQAFDGIIAAIQRLKPVDRELIALLATESFSYREIGKMLNIREDNVKVKVHRARTRLREILASGG